MPCNSMEEARNEMFRMLAVGMPAGLFIKFQGIEPARQALASEDWCAAYLNVVSGPQSSLAGDAGKRQYNKIGFIEVQSFGSMQRAGYSNALRLSEAVESCFRGKTGAGGIWFRDFRSTPVGQTNAWYQFNTTIDFEFSQYA